VGIDLKLTKIEKPGRVGFFLVPKLLLGNALGTKALLWTAGNENTL